MSTTIAKEKVNKPIIIKKIDGKSKIIRLQNLIIPTQLNKDHLIYESTPGDFLKGEPHVKVILTNQVNMLTNSSRTVAQYVSLADNRVIKEKTSDNIAKLIGQKNYDIIFASLCSVISQELKIRGMLALLTEKEEKPAPIKEPVKGDGDNLKTKQKRRRNKLTPYVVKNTVTDKLVHRVFVDPKMVELETKSEIKREKDPVNVEKVVQEPDLIQIDKPFDEDSCHSIRSDISGLSGHTNISNIALVEKTNELLQEIDERTDRTYVDEIETKPMVIQLNEHIEMPDGTRIMVPCKPEDDFHIATPEILRNVTNEERKKLLWFQAYKDWKLCLDCDEDGLLPLHNAVLNNDVDLVRRQSLVLRNRQESLDILGANRTALQMALNQNNVDCAAMLLQYGADPFYTDEEERTALHLAAELSPEMLQAVLRHCQNNAPQILLERELWTPFMDNKTKIHLTSYLMDHVCQMIDSQGYTPLMLAAKIGNHSNVKQLVEVSLATINMSMPNSGNTALYLAVEGACLDAGGSNNRTKVAEKFLKTIEILVENGADPSIDNNSGTNVNVLLTEFNIAELSMLVANKLTCMKYFNGNIPSGSKNFDAYILIKDKQENIKLAQLEKTKIKNTEIKKEVKTESSKPTILANVPVKKACLPRLKDFRKINPNEKLGINKLHNSSAPNSQQTISNSQQTISNSPQTISNSQQTISNSQQTISNSKQTISNSIPIIQNQIIPDFVVQMAKAKDNTENKLVLNNKNQITKCRIINQSNIVIAPSVISNTETGANNKEVNASKKRLTAAVNNPTTKKQRLLKSLEQ